MTRYEEFKTKTLSEMKAKGLKCVNSKGLKVDIALNHKAVKQRQSKNRGGLFGDLLTFWTNQMLEITLTKRMK